MAAADLTLVPDGTDGTDSTGGASGRAARTTAERAAAVLRGRVTDGTLPPGARLSEQRLADELEVSRNTLREAFRLLTHDGLLVHRLNRGVFVPELGEDDLVDVFRLRRAVECAAVRSLADLDDERLTPLRVEVDAADAARARGDWLAVGTANMRFHQGLVGLAGSRRMDEVTRRLLAEIRLVFHVATSPQELHGPYVERNRHLLDLIASGQAARAADELDQYLRDAEQQLRLAYRHEEDADG